MTKTLAFLCLLLSLGSLEVLSAEPDTEGFDKHARPFLQRYCVKCHGADKQNAGVRLDKLGPMTADFEFGEIWREVQSQSLLKAMPPEEEPQPSEKERLAFLDWVNREIQRAETAFAGSGKAVVLRRLNKSEYRNTIRDLLYLDEFVDPAINLPDDDTFHGFDNIGSALNISPVQLRTYLETADTMLQLAFPEELKTPSPKHLHIEPLDMADWYAKSRALSRERNQISENTELTPAVRGKMAAEVQQLLREHNARAQGKTYFDFGTQIIEALEDGLRFTNTARFSFGGRPDGIYRFRIKARGLPGSDGAMPLLIMEFGATREEITVLTTDLAPKMKVYEGEFLRGPGFGLLRIYARGMGNGFHYRGSDKQKPQAVLASFELEGPFPSPLREKANKVYFGGVEDSDAGAREVLTRFMERAFRRPPAPERVEQFLTFYRAQRAEGQAFRPALLSTMRGVLAAPEFLFMLEDRPGEGKETELLDDFELASRLSYFLTSAPPDQELYALARTGELTDPDTLLAQARRLMSSPRASAFAQNFTGQWLQLRTLGDMAPDDRKYTEWEETLQESMRKETETFFLRVLQEQLPLTTLLQSDFTMLNSRLANFYGIPDVEGYEFRPVNLSPENPRGGLLTHASILTLTSDGIRTSPVKRGAFLLENILGDPPPPPPNNVPPVKETTGATLRERLASHRDLPACASCHADIDPLGFALENFNAIGKWREHEEDTKLPVDPSGTMPSGARFENFPEFRNLLSERRDDVARCLAEKLMMYSLGRAPTFTDKPALQRVVEQTKADGYKLSTMVESIILSEPFLTK
ncbi:Planctomycete cytochrome C [Lignipirellula cremea]|uniref:Planctomycete cytochrome C n=2 Tax=Lignipirellula cremea TaxID=2528010 RepID=A0A518DVF4_9BACT|nr:Planctomycete cytochrome C [Lignipirellula cremea]